MSSTDETLRRRLSLPGGLMVAMLLAAGSSGRESILAHAATDANAGTAVPDCPLQRWDSPDSIHLEKLRGNVLYVDFWASWCVPCARSFAFMNDLHDEFKDRGLRIIAVNLDEDAAEANRFLERHPASFTIAATDGAQCAHAFGVPGMPSSYVIDRTGTIRHVHIGFRRDDARSLREAIERIVDESPTRQ